jgi:hypothetical protein
VLSISPIALVYRLILNLLSAVGMINNTQVAVSTDYFLGAFGLTGYLEEQVQGL